MSETHSNRIKGSQPILRVSKLDKVFPSDNGDTVALSNIDLNIEKGEFICLLGASGCGKSTLLRIIAGFENATAGEAALYGRVIDKPGPDRGIVFQDYALFPWLTVYDNISFGPHHRGHASKEVKKITDKFIDMVGLSAFANHYPSQLSGGMKQRVAIARVLANDTDLLLMDEPFGALDALTRAKLQEELLDIWAQTNLTVIFVTHSVEEAVVLADRIVVMSASPGRIDSDIAVDLPRPRDVSSEEFNAVRRSITKKLSSNIGPVRAKMSISGE
ncbi:ABC transporter ATP-binding protein [Thalassospiraceae bacterium LMO-JJ14]|nr:ABC transporter ATP-binding protein [Thalassospiraceae bacterium LMO-JJ14]